jgi:hypothetical protein
MMFKLVSIVLLVVLVLIPAQATSAEDDEEELVDYCFIGLLGETQRTNRPLSEAEDMVDSGSGYLGQCDGRIRDVEPEEVVSEICDVGYIEGSILILLAEITEFDDAVRAVSDFLVDVRTECYGYTFDSTQFGVSGDVVTDPMEIASGFYRVTLESSSRFPSVRFTD